MQSNTQWTEEIDRIASIIRKANLESSIKWGAEVFTYKGRNIVSYGGFKHFFTIWFYNGVFLKDPYNVLVNAQEGKTKALRQWRFTSMEEINEKQILEYISEAIEVEKQGLKIVPDKNTSVEKPEVLVVELQSDKKLSEAFEKLTPGRQKEYVLYLLEAKQLTTKLKRLEKIKPMIIDGIGLNDKYK